MSVLVYAESWKGNFRKSTFEAVSYANETAKLLDTHLAAFSLGEISDDMLNKLGNYGVKKIISFNNIIKETVKQLQMQSKISQMILLY